MGDLLSFLSSSPSSSFQLVLEVGVGSSRPPPSPPPLATRRCVTEVNFDENWIVVRLGGMVNPVTVRDGQEERM